MHIWIRLSAHQISKNYSNKIPVANRESENKIVKFISLKSLLLAPTKVISVHAAISWRKEKRSHSFKYYDLSNPITLKNETEKNSR